jgi:subtilisin family serine protease
LQCGVQDHHGHGSHCSGILAGQRGAVGLAGSAQIIMVNNAILNSNPNETCEYAGGLSGMSFYDLESIMEAGYSPAVISNSWGAGVTDANYYSAENAGFDAFLYENPSVLMLFAAGNGGQEDFSPQALSRNVLSVGSTTDYKTMSDFSSAGPTIDRKGRMTVHVVTNGQGVLSANAFVNVGHTLKSGTSMATPLAAGIATLLREWLTIERMVNQTSTP